MLRRYWGGVWGPPFEPQGSFGIGLEAEARFLLGAGLPTSAAGRGGHPSACALTEPRSDTSPLSTLSCPLSTADQTHPILGWSTGIQAWIHAGHPCPPWTSTPLSEPAPEELCWKCHSLNFLRQSLGPLCAWHQTAAQAAGVSSRPPFLADPKGEPAPSSRNL